MTSYARRLLRDAPKHARKWADLAYELAKVGHCRDAEVYLRKVERMMARRASSLGGHVRTCVQYKCVRGRGKKDPEADCKAGYVLRCAKYAALPGFPVRVDTRKPYQEFTYGRYRRGRGGARDTYPPDFTFDPPYGIARRVRGLPPARVQSGKGRRG
jgi:hypothetical protein